MLVDHALDVGLELFFEVFEQALRCSGLRQLQLLVLVFKFSLMLFGFVEGLVALINS